MPVSSTQLLKEVFLLSSFVAKAKIRYSFSDAATPYLPYLMLEAAAHVLPTSNTDTDICSAPVEIPGGLPFGDIRTPNLSVRLKELELQCDAHYTPTCTQVCENGVILTEPSLLRSFLCVCRGEFGQCRDPGESLYLIAPFWSDVNNISATQDTSISYQIFEEGNTTHAQTLEYVWRYIDSIVPDGTQFFPMWMMVAYWNSVHPYIRPNVINPRVSPFNNPNYYVLVKYFSLRLTPFRP